ncbi:hypothetical protein PtB15_12B51 [Puccinia triticina]|nr:hypothetical protein PtB15_12B51 [Puccinia triticina]
MSMAYHDLQVHTTSLRATLSQGSLVWKQLELPGHSAEEKAHLASQLTQVQEKLDSLLEQTGTLASQVLDRFNSIRSVMLFFIPATSLVFMLSFWKLAQKYKSKGTSKAELSDSGQAQSSSQDISARSHISRTSQTLFQTLRSDPQFLRLTIRASATFLGMLIALFFWLLALFKSNDMLIDPYWHGVATWLPTVSGSWTAIPVVWQSMSHPAQHYPPPTLPDSKSAASDSLLSKTSSSFRHRTFHTAFGPLSVNNFLRKDWIKYYVFLVLLLIAIAVVAIYHHQIVIALHPFVLSMRNLKINGVEVGWLIPVAVLFIISFPPLFGHEIVIILCGLVWGLWLGFAIVCLGTLLGELAN